MIDKWNHINHMNLSWGLKIIAFLNEDKLVSEQKHVEISEDEIELKINFSCNQCGNDRQIESELSQEWKASGRQGHTEKNKFAQVTIN